MRQKISLICPTRERTKMLDRLVKNIFNKGTSNLNDEGHFELLLIVDNDDSKTKDFYPKKLKKYATIKLISRERSTFFNRDYMTFGAQNSSGDLIWGIGDDMEIVTDNWDQILINKINIFEKLVSDGVLSNNFYGWSRYDFAYLINIDCGDGDFQIDKFCRCSFPIITREAFQKLNFFTPPEWKFWGADYGLGEIYRKCGRVFSMHELKVVHWSHKNNNKKYIREKDIINSNSQKISESCPMTKASYKRQEEVINKYVDYFIGDKNIEQVYYPSRVSTEILFNPLKGLREEIINLQNEFLEEEKTVNEIAAECPACKFEDYNFEMQIPECPDHGLGSLWSVIWKDTDRFGNIELKSTQYCSQEGCDYKIDITSISIKCPNPKCEYEGLLDYKLQDTIDSHARHNNLKRRIDVLIIKHNHLAEVFSKFKET